MSPVDLRQRSARALALLATGLGVRAVAREIGCAPSAVVYWRRAAKAGTLGAWDRHGTAGGRYSDDDCARARARRTLRHMPSISEDELRRRSQKSDWLNAHRVKVAYARLSLTLPHIAGTRVITRWDLQAMAWAFDLYALHAAHESFADDRKELLHGWPDLSALFQYRLRCMGFICDEQGLWAPPPAAEAHARLAMAVAVGSWPVPT